jgi:hypothetical protein
MKKVFLAGIYHGGLARPGSRSIHLRVTEKVRYPHVLESFHYADDRMAIPRQWPADIFG